jgi:prepilin-type N-terminal cleavage/methylation domain-containing protein
MGFMTKNRNKGFSLIEVIIGVAVLTILITPVVKQLAQTMRTNRLAKEQQYANESATNVLEYAQKTSFNDLKVTTSSSDDGVYVTDVSEKKDRKCDIYIFDTSTGAINPISSYASSKTTGGSELTVAYSTRTYKMNDVKLGSRRTEYTRTLILDDLSNKISEVTYNNTSGTDTFGLQVYYYDSSDPLSVKADISGDSTSGLAYTSEGSIVSYATDSDGETYINGIVCVKKSSGKAVSDPNESPLGSMHDLVSTQVALVNGDITNYDTQAESDLYAAAMAYLKVYNTDAYDSILNSKVDVNVLSTNGYLSNLKKSVTITIDQGVSKTNAKPYYLIKVDVHYTSKPNLNDEKQNVELDYNVFSQRFYYTDTGDPETTATVPAVYIEYQPFAIDGVNYSADEYIYIKNYVDNAVVYLYQPAKDLTYAQSTGSSLDKNSVESASGSYSSNGTDVKLHINKIDSTSGSKTTDNKRTYIYTNLVKTKTDDTTGATISYVDTDSQFDLNTINLSDAIYSSTEYSAFEYVNPTDTEYNDSKSAGGKKAYLYLKSIQDDKVNNDRLYTATVVVAPKTESVNSVTLTGAKGGQ